MERGYIEEGPGNTRASHISQVRTCYHVRHTHNNTCNTILWYNSNRDFFEKIIQLLNFFVLEIMDELSANWRIGSGSKYIEEELSLCNIISTNPQFSGLASPSQSVQNSWKRKFRPHSLKLPTLPGNLESSTPCGVSSILFLLVIH